MTETILVGLLVLQLTGLRPHLPQSLVSRLTSIVAPASSKAPANLPDTAFIAYPSLNHSQAAPALGAKASLAIDVATGRVLYEHGADDQRPIASITKLATVLVIIRHHSLDETVTVPTLPAYQPDDAIMGLKAGEQFTVRELLTACLIKSANDAADALAIWDAGSSTKFADKMNAETASWGLTGMHFSNPSGLVDANNYATARSLARLARLDLTNPTVKTLVNTRAATITDRAGDSFSLRTTNDLLNDERFHGIKTGYTEAAGQSVVSLATINGHDVITVVLGSPDRFGETATLVNYLQGAYTWQ